MKVVQIASILLSCSMLNHCGDGGHRAHDEQETSAGTIEPQVTMGGEVLDNLAIAADIKGNGGDVVVCFNDIEARDQIKDKLLRNRSSQHAQNPFEEPETLRAVKSTQLLDLYEYSLPIGFPPLRREVLPVQQEFTQELGALIARIAKKSGLGARLLKELEEIPLNHWTAAPGILEIDDSELAIMLPSECLLVQIAARRENRIYYDASIFKLMDEQNRLALVFHELVYKIAADGGQRNSQKARGIVGVLMSKDEFDAKSPMELHQIFEPLGKFGFPYAIGSRNLWVSDAMEIEAGRLKRARLADGQRLESGSYEYETAADKESGRPNFEELDSGLVRVLVTGQADGIALREPLYVTIDHETLEPSYIASPTTQGALIGYCGREFRVDNAAVNGGVIASLFSTGSNIDLPEARVHVTREVVFHPGSCKIKSIYVPNHTSFMTAYGHAGVQATVELYENEYLKSVYWFTHTHFELPESSSHISLDKTMVYFGPGRNLERAVFSKVSEQLGSYTWPHGNANGIGEITFYPNNRVRQIDFSHRNSKMIYDWEGTGHKELRVVGEVTLEFDEEGRLRTD